MAAGQRRLESSAGRRLPVGQPLPEQPVEFPDETVAHRTEVVQGNRPAVAGRRRGARATRPAPKRLLRIGQQRRQPFGFDLAQVDGDLGQRQHPALSIDGAPDDHRIAEVGAVLNPIEMNPQRRQRAHVDLSLLEERRERFNDPPGELGERLPRPFPSGARRLKALVEMDDHRTRR